MMKPVIRRMTPQDHECVKQLWIDCGLSEEPEDQIEDIAEFLVSPQSAALIAHEDGEITGVALCGNDGRYGYIHHLAVAKMKRKAGIGRALVQACVDFLQKKHIIIMVREHNETGKEFWNNMCFQKVDGLCIHALKANAE